MASQNYDLTVEQGADFELTIPVIDDDGQPIPIPTERGNYYWHTDKSYHAVPSLLTK